MNKSISWTRQQYEDAYRLYRRFAATEDIIWTEDTPKEIVRAADYSYQAFSHATTGWLNNSRRRLFITIKRRRFHESELPF